MPAIDALLREMLQRQASDLHLTAGRSPGVRVDGRMIPLDGHAVLASDTNREMLCEIMPAPCRKEFEENWDSDFAYAIPGEGRFRVNAFVDSNGVGAVVRQIPSKVPTADDLGLPAVVKKLCELNRGLVVVTGPTGSGKSTTLAAMIDYINKTRSDHIITIEDPIEFLHHPDQCFINQRELGRHTRSFPSALRAALREDPDIVLVGEMRDLDTIEIALETAETGHLVFGTLHTNTAPSTIDRIVGKFPADRQNQIRTMLAASLKGVIAQTLCRKKGGGRVAAMEILVATTAISACIREGKTHQIASALQVGKKEGMQLLNENLAQLVTDSVISPDEARTRAIDKEDIETRLRRMGAEQDVGATVPLGGVEEARKGRLDGNPNEIGRYWKMLSDNPKNVPALNNLAWLLATAGDDELRNGDEAVKLAQRALQLSDGRESLLVLSTLAAAYAETGEFNKAQSLAQTCLVESEKSGFSELRQEIAGHLALYSDQKALHVMYPCESAFSLALAKAKQPIT